MKQKLYKIYGLIHSLKYPRELLSTIKSIFDERVHDNAKHIQMAAEWLLYMQNEDGGYSRKFSLITGRDKSYIETTGYVVATMLDAAESLNKEEYRRSAFRAGEWLLKIQNEDGSFSEIDFGKPFAFDTGQVLMGLNRLYKESGDERYLSAAQKAAYWLMDHQEDDGSWQKVAYNEQKHSYYSRVAAAMYEYAKMNDDRTIESAAKKQINWVLDQQQGNGFFRYARFTKELPAFLHTIVYILEGLLDIYRIDGDKKILDAVVNNVNKFVEINLSRDILLCSQYDEDFNCVNGERCMTGLAQWAGVLLRLYEELKNEEYLHCAEKTLYYLKAKQIKEGEVLHGSLMGSMPFWGRYAPFSAVNWGTKFFIDALLAQIPYEASLIDQSDRWIGECFRFHNSVVNPNISKTGMHYISGMEEYIQKSGRILDLGCGEGKYIRYFKNRYPDKEIEGIDPVFHNEQENIKQGNSYKIEASKKYDLIYAMEVFQHIKYPSVALAQIADNLTDKGYLIICDKNPLSISGVLKPLMEFSGRWMYPFDSPFREKWYSTISWKRLLISNGFEVEKMETFIGKTGKIGWIHKNSIIIARKKR